MARKDKKMSDEILETQEETLLNKIEEVAENAEIKIQEILEDAKEEIEEAVSSFKEEAPVEANVEFKDSVIRIGDKVKVVFCHDPKFIGVEGEVTYKSGLGTATIKTSNGFLNLHISNLEKK